jgi:hypothetical protein
LSAGRRAGDSFHVDLATLCEYQSNNVAKFGIAEPVIRKPCIALFATSISIASVGFHDRNLAFKNAEMSVVGSFFSLPFVFYLLRTSRGVVR